jgi:hypothetical protein
MLIKPRSLSLQYLWWSCRDCSGAPWRGEASSYSSHIPTSPAALPLTLKRQCHEIFLLQVSTTPVANNGNRNNIRLLTPESGFWRKKIIYILTLLSKGVQTKYLRLFQLKIFSICHRCQRHRWCTLSWDYLCEFSNKLEWPYWGLGETDSWKKTKVENLVALSL